SRGLMIALQVDQKGGDVRRADPGDPTSLAERTRTELRQLLAGLGAQLRDRLIIEVRRDRLVLQTPEPVGLFGLTRDVTPILAFNHNWLDGVDVGRGVGERRVEGDDLVPLGLGPPEAALQGLPLHSRVLDLGPQAFDPVTAGLEAGPAGVVHEADFASAPG